jgi:hypothetical protein
LVEGINENEMDSAGASMIPCEEEAPARADGSMTPSIEDVLVPSVSRDGRDLESTEYSSSGTDST